MAFNIEGFERLFIDSGKKTSKCFYKTTDPLSTVLGSGYFNNVAPDNLVAGEIIECTIDTDGNPFVVTLRVASVSSGVVTMAGPYQEFTADGAVTPGVMSVELNDSSTAGVATTIASSLAHQDGIFVVKDTSTAGTATCTLTLTAGTFDGTNNVATLNAPGECLAVKFDSGGDGIVIENVGTVGLS